jgi:Domain of unknown function (DUF1835)
MIDLDRALHIVGGDSAAGSLRIALRPGPDRVLINEDLLSCGPAPATADLGVWRSARERYMREIYGESPHFSFGGYAASGLLMNAERLSRERAIAVWAGLGLPEQLLLVWVIFLFDQLELNLSKLAIFQFETLRPTQNVLSLGELSPEDIRGYKPAPHQLSPEEADELRRLWKVYTSDDPADLARYAAGSSAMPIAHRAVRELLYRYPDVRSGLGVWDECLLRHTLDNGPRAVRVIGHTLGSMSLDWQGDMHLFRRLVGMAGVRSPLISLTGSHESMRGCEVRLTSFGHDVLAGNANTVHENGIDDWIGGVHLGSKRNVTFRSGDSLILS